MQVQSAAEHLFALHELEFQGSGSQQRLQGEAASAMPRLGGAALCSLHDLAHGLLQVLLVCDCDEVRFSVRNHSEYLVAWTAQTHTIDNQSLQPPGRCPWPAASPAYL